jgi:hypothetical protein
MMGFVCNTAACRVTSREREQVDERQRQMDHFRYDLVIGELRIDRSIVLDREGALKLVLQWDIFGS